jgi:hypothetical protein
LLKAPLGRPPPIFRQFLSANRIRDVLNLTTIRLIWEDA